MMRSPSFTTRFLIRTLTAVANIFTVKKSGPASMAVTASHVCSSSIPHTPLPPRIVSRPSPFVHGGLKCDCRGLRKYKPSISGSHYKLLSEASIETCKFSRNAMYAYLLFSCSIYTDMSRLSTCIKVNRISFRCC